MVGARARSVYAWLILSVIAYIGTFMILWMGMPHANDEYDGHRWRTVEFHHTWLTWSPVWFPCFYVMHHVCGYQAEAEWMGGSHSVGPEKALFKLRQPSH